MFSNVWDLLGCVSAPVFVLAFVAGVFRWTTGPIVQAAANSNSPRSLLLTDLIWRFISPFPDHAFHVVRR